MIDFAEEDMGPCVPFVPFRCPHCGRNKPRTTGANGRKRYHRCQSCGRRYSSWELPSESVKDWDAPPGDRPGA